LVGTVAEQYVPKGQDQFASPALGVGDVVQGLINVEMSSSWRLSTMDGETFQKTVPRRVHRTDHNEGVIIVINRD
jgi:hypothetical protein